MSITLFLAGDVMTGRGIDQILPVPSDPILHELYVRDARDYVALAERVSGPITRPVDFSYIWGIALEVLARITPQARIVNLETSVTRSNHHWPGKGINYRMHPANVPCLLAAKLDCCVLANNHVLDWGYEGLQETLATLHAAGLSTAGAGGNVQEAATPAVIELEGQRRVLVFAFGSKTSGIPFAWAAGQDRPGINLLGDLSRSTARRTAEAMNRFKRPGDIVIASIHWGHNWGYTIPQEQRTFAREWIDSGAVDGVHGHSSHHPKGIELYRDRPILYGCGDLLNDYEGIGGYERFRGDLGLMYFLSFDSVGRVERLRAVPTRVERFRLQHPTRSEVLWLKDMLDREGADLGTGAALSEDGSLTLIPRS